MVWTEQERVLDAMKEKYGETAFTEDHQNYKRVGFKRKGATLSAIGHTWDEAMAELERKAA